MFEKARVDKKDYELLGECIVSDQVPASLIAQYFNDDAFKKWYRKRYGLTKKSKKSRQRR